MKVIQNNIPHTTIEAIARSLYKETMHYGFKQVDYIKFINLLLDLSLKNNDNRQIQNNTKQTIKNKFKELKLPIITDKLKIREYDDKHDLHHLNKWISEKKNQLFLLSRVTARISNLELLITDENNIFGIISLLDLTPIGLLAFLDHDKNQHKAELRKLISDPKYRGMGLAKEATRLWIQYGISQLKIKKIYLNTLNSNIRNIKLNEELGFRVEGILRNECLIDGVYHDILKMGLWHEDFKF